MAIDYDKLAEAVTRRESRFTKGDFWLSLVSATRPLAPKRIAYAFTEAKMVLIMTHAAEENSH
ncbi:MAG: hypothetical protein U5L96_04295 [Owenweeksia sp.]|nr:hypothetical protein [Owenweeksia sp.]